MVVFAARPFLHHFLGLYFPTPFEFDAINENWDEVKGLLVSADLSKWQTRSHRRSMSPKGRYSYRSATQLDPLDSLIFAGLIYEIGSKLEEYRIPEEDQIVFSHRFAPEKDGRLYSAQSNWGTFLDRCTELASPTEVTHVVVTDIADFYPRLYHHNIENALRDATGKSQHVPVLKKMISHWAEGEASYGLPIGPAGTRIIADVTINDVDETLRSEGATFCRFSDDYRIFCKSGREAYEKLELLATTLHRDHGLTLQSGKTTIVPKDEFVERYLSTDAQEELGNLYGKFRELMNQLGRADAYEDIDYDDLDPNAQALVDELNLEDLLRQQLARDDIDVGIMKFILRRLAQLDDKDVVDELLGKIDHCYPVVSHLVEYLLNLESLEEPEKHEIGSKLIEAVRSGLVGHLPYHRAWLLHVFASDADWDNKKEFVRLWGTLSQDGLSQRKLILALGRSRQAFWFRARKKDVFDLGPWQRRAFLAGASCLPTDEGNHWYKSMQTKLDPLEATVVKWVRNHPF